MWGLVNRPQCFEMCVQLIQVIWPCVLFVSTSFTRVTSVSVYKKPNEALMCPVSLIYMYGAFVLTVVACCNGAHDIKCTVHLVKILQTTILSST